MTFTCSSWKRTCHFFEFAKGTMNLVSVSETFRPPIRNIVWHQTVLPRLLNTLKMDVLHVPTYRRMLWSAPCASVATIHDLAQFRIARKYDPLRMLYSRGVARHLAQFQNEIIAISQSTADDIERFFRIPPEHIHVIHHGVDFERFSPGDRTQAAVYAAARWKLDRPFLLYVSRIEHPSKNHLRMIEAFNEFRVSTRSNYLLALAGRDSFRSEVVHAAAERSPFDQDIRFLGFVDDSALPMLYRAAKAMVYPSLFEGFGHPPIEAMACGCPVVTSTRGSLAEVVDGSAGIFDPERVDDIAAALTRISTDPEWCAHLSAAGIANVRRFDWNKNAEHVLSVYSEAIERHRTYPSRLLRGGIRMTH